MDTISAMFALFNGPCGCLSPRDSDISLGVIQESGIGT